MSDQINQPEPVKAPVRNVFSKPMTGYDAMLMANKRAELRARVSVKTTDISMSPWRDQK